VRFAVAALVALAGAGDRVIASHGVRLVAPAGWQRIQAAGDGPVVDPRTLLVVGTAGVRAKQSQCQIAAYRVPSGGAVIVVVGWKTATSGGGRIRPGRAPLEALRAVRRPSFECFTGRGAAAEVVLGGRAYQVNVMVGDRASKPSIEAALAVARSFDLNR